MFVQSVLHAFNNHARHSVTNLTLIGWRSFSYSTIGTASHRDSVHQMCSYCSTQTTLFHICISPPYPLPPSVRLRISLSLSLKTKNKPDTDGATASEAYYAPLLFNTDLWLAAPTRRRLNEDYGEVENYIFLNLIPSIAVNPAPQVLVYNFRKITTTWW